MSANEEGIGVAAILLVIVLCVCLVAMATCGFQCRIGDTTIGIEKAK